MNPEDQIAALLAKANPVPSLDLLDPVEPVDVDSLWDQSEKEITELEATRSWRPDRPRLALAMAVIAILVVGITRFIDVSTPDVTPPAGPLPTPTEQVAMVFMDALNEHDGLAIRGMWALDHQDEFNPDGWVSLTNINRALGFEHTEVDCVELTSMSFPDGTPATPVACSFTFQQDLARALGLEAIHGKYLLHVSGGEIVRAIQDWRNRTSWEESFEEFRSWVEQTHTDDYWTMYPRPEENLGRLTIGYYDNLMSVEPEALDLWERYVDEFVAEMGG